MGASFFYLNYVTSPNGIPTNFYKYCQIIHDEALLSISIQILSRNKYTIALLDTGASKNFIELRFIRGMMDKAQPLTNPTYVKGAWGDTQSLTHLISLSFSYKNQTFTDTFYIIDCPLPKPIVLGLPFCQKHPAILTENLAPQHETVHSIRIVDSRQIKKELKDPTVESYLLWLSDADKPISQDLSNDIIKEFSDVIVDSIPSNVPSQPTSTPTTKHYIELKEGAQPVAKRAYRMSPSDQEELNKQLKELIQADKIFPSDSPFAAPVIFVKKKDGSKRLCVDYRALNEITIKSRFPLPLIEEVLDSLHGASIFSKLDLISGYHQVGIEEPDQYKTAFITTNGQYTWRVMPFGLTNAPATFQRLMNHVLRNYINKICVVYLDDILIFSKDKNSHKKHIEIILTTLREHGLYAKKNKCQFYLKTVGFLGYTIDSSGITPDNDKIQIIQQWPTPTTAKDALSFLGLAGYYRRFIANFSMIAKPLHQFATKNSLWSTTCENAFNQLKKLLSSSPIIIPYDNTKDIILTTDASHDAIGAILELYQDGKTLGVVAYMSHLLHTHELNWPIREKELYAVIFAFKKWRHYLLGKHIIVRSDHHSLQYIKTEKNNNHNERVARWWDFLAEYDFEIDYIKGNTNRADALSRPASLNNLSVSTLEWSSQELDTLTEEYHQDHDCDLLIKALQDDSVQLTPALRTSIRQHTYTQSLLYYQKDATHPRRIRLPDGTIRNKILQQFHDSAAAGHAGTYRTLQGLLLHYYWPQMEHSVRTYCQSCLSCQQNKHPVLLPPGTFFPNETGNHRWSHINMDILDGLPTSDGYNAILVIIDRATKMSHFIPCTTHLSAYDTADLLLEHVIKHHGVPMEILSDQAPVFTSQLWQRLTQRFNITLKFTSTYNASTNGQVERTNRTLIEILRSYCTDSISAWASLLPTAEFSYNNTYQTSIETTPFFANFGYHPRIPGFTHLLTSGGMPEIAHPGTDFADLDDFMNRQKTIFLLIQERISKSQLQQAIHYNEHHRQVVFQPNDSVLVHRSAYWPGTRSGRKLHHVWYGPFSVTSVDGENCTLELPATRIRRNNVIHRKFLKHYVTRLLPIVNVPPVTPQDVYHRTDEILSILRLYPVHKVIEVQWNHCEPEDISFIYIAQVNRTEYLNRLFDDFEGSPNIIGTNPFHQP